MGLVKTLGNYPGSIIYDCPVFQVTDGLSRLLAEWMPAACAELEAETGVEMYAIPLDHITLGDNGSTDPYYMYWDYNYLGTQPNIFTNDSANPVLFIRAGTNADGDLYRRTDNYIKIVSRTLQIINASDVGYQDLLIGWPANLDPLNAAHQFLIKEIHSGVKIIFTGIEGLPDNDTGNSTFGMTAGVKIPFVVTSNKKRSS